VVWNQGKIVQLLIARQDQREIVDDLASAFPTPAARFGHAPCSSEGSSPLPHLVGRLKEELSMTPEEFLQFAEILPEAMLLTTSAGRVLAANRSSAELFQRPAAELRGEALADIVFDSPEQIAAFLRASSRTRDFALGAVACRGPNQKRIECRCEGALLRPRGEGVDPLLVLRLATIPRLLESNQRCLEQERDKLLQLIELQIERMPLAYLVSDADFRYVEFNPAAEKMFGFTRAEALGKHPFELIVPPSSQRLVQGIFDRLLAGDMAAHGDCENVTKDGHPRICEWHNTPLRAADGRFLGLVSMALDITERRRLEEQFRQSQKMEAIGRLAGGIAHDFNNLLTIITGCGDLILQSLRPGDPHYESVEQIIRTSERAASLTQQLLTFSRNQVLVFEEIDLNEVVSETDKMLRRLIGRQIEFISRLDPDLGRVNADPGQIAQVVLNLVVNARDAMPNGGRLTIETRNLVFDEADAARQPEIPPGPYALLAITDTGCGMDEVVQSRLFEPFFTTKDVGKGTGMGLATVYGIVRQCNGMIVVTSAPGRGTTFEVYLPQIAAAAI
jgi:PAS domain S-box-containing protein